MFRPDPDPDDLVLLADRLRLGLPLRGFDGRDIPLYDDAGVEIDAIDAAHALLLSGASLLPAVEADAFIAITIARAEGVEAASLAGGDTRATAAAKVTGVLVSAAVRAAATARGRDCSPSGLNRATLSWYQVHDLRRRELLDAALTTGETWLTA